MIKNLKPSGNGKYKQGYFMPKNPQKYIGDPNKIIFRSSWEYRFASWCDMHPTITKWSSEPLAIPYVSPIDNKWHNYYVDFYVCSVRDGKEQQYIIEIKPKAQREPPDKKLLEGNRTLKKLQRYNAQLKTYLINQAKWEAAKQFAAGRGMRFAVCDENFLF